MVIDETTLKHVGDNIRATLVGDYAVLVVDLNRTFGLTKSGKSRTIATSRMFKPLLDNDTVFNLWVGRNLR